MRTGRKPGPYRSESYAVRLYNSPDQSAEKEALDEWIAGALPFHNGQPSNAFRAVLLDLIRYRLGKAAPVQAEPVGPVSLDHLKAEIMAEVKEWLRGIISDDTRFNDLTEARRQHVESDGGAEMTDAILNNMLEDLL